MSDEAAQFSPTDWVRGRAVAAFPSYADYQRNTDREIPVFVLEPTS